MGYSARESAVTLCLGAASQNQEKTGVEGTIVTAPNRPGLGGEMDWELCASTTANRMEAAGARSHAPLVPPRGIGYFGAIVPPVLSARAVRCPIAGIAAERQRIAVSPGTHSVFRRCG